ncbi:hypothetical protein [Palleronia abyssalis]|uniref:Uncharacterized protein n=1 Tax=Palleronia abyssalis TaxID=1501240 RepID=A0A2R8BTZ4_9RHOB|nr:hypothetical protein [Palleronia abyssalis]SPJ23608.1 hypothetical protein PAA8504_01421 [Palleronia abyssalis]
MQARFAALIAAAFLAGPVHAERALVAEDGTVYAETSGPSGSRLSGKSQTILLSDECAAEIPGKGRGTWYWTGRGTHVTVGTYSVRFDGNVPLIPLYRCVG